MYAPKPLTRGFQSWQIILIILSTKSLCLRFWSRAVTPGIGFGLDDWLALLSLPPALATCALSLDGIKYGVGHHISDVSLSDIEHILGADLYVGIILYEIVSALPKLSALAFYNGVFDLKKTGNRIWKLVVDMVAITTILWMIGAILVNIFQCSPIDKFWHPLSTTGHCISLPHMFMVNSVIDALLDVTVLLIPLPILRKLQMSMTRKVLLFLTFILGYGVAIISVGRAIQIITIADKIEQDFPYEVIFHLFWSSADAGLSILVISLPAIFHLIARACNLGMRAILSTNSSSSASFHRGYAKSRRNGSFSKLNGHDNCWRAETRAEEVGREGAANLTSAATFDGDIINVPLESIYVRTEVQVSAEGGGDTGTDRRHAHP